MTGFYYHICWFQCLYICHLLFFSLPFKMNSQEEYNAEIVVGEY